MTRAQRQCGYCGLDLVEDRARFEVRVAADYQPRPEACPGTYCGYECWEAAKTRKVVHDSMKTLISDAETVLSDEGKLLGGR